MMTNPDVVFSTDPRHGLVARSGWEQEEARTVLRDLGWEWTEELHALVPPNDMAEVDAGVQAVEELHLHGQLTGYAVGPYGAMRLPLDRAEAVFTKAAISGSLGEQQVGAMKTDPQNASHRPSAYTDSAPPLEPIPVDDPDSPNL